MAIDRLIEFVMGCVRQAFRGSGQRCLHQRLRRQN